MLSFIGNGATIKVQHDGRAADCKVVESFFTEGPVRKGDDTLPANCWYLSARIKDPDLRAACERGELAGWSMGGLADAKEEVD